MSRSRLLSNTRSISEARRKRVASDGGQARIGPRGKAAVVAMGGKYDAPVAPASAPGVASALCGPRLEVMVPEDELEGALRDVRRKLSHALEGRLSRTVAGLP